MVSLLAGAQVLGALAAGSGRVVVRAIIWPNYVVTLSPKSFQHGTVAFIVKNRNSKPQQFAIAGFETKLIAPGGTRDLTVTLSKRGLYAFTLPDYQHTSVYGYTSVGGQVRVT